MQEEKLTRLKKDVENAVAIEKCDERRRRGKEKMIVGGEKKP